MIRINRHIEPSKDAVLSEGLVLQFAAKGQTVQELLDKAPHPSHDVLQHIQRLMDQEFISLLPPRKAPSSAEKPVLDPTFSAYKQVLKALLSNPDVLPRPGAIVSFCISFYDNMLILTARQGVFVHCKAIRVGSDNDPVQKAIKGDLGRIDDDPVFSTVYRSGTAFFGKSFPCRLLERFIDPLPDNDCALIPILKRDLEIEKDGSNG